MFSFIKTATKLEFQISSMNKGKSGSARLVTYVVYSESTVFLVAIFTKSERSSITDKEIRQLIKELEGD